MNPKPKQLTLPLAPASEKPKPPRYDRGYGLSGRWKESRVVVFRPVLRTNANGDTREAA